MAILKQLYVPDIHRRQAWMKQGFGTSSKIILLNPTTLYIYWSRIQLPFFLLLYILKTYFFNSLLQEISAPAFYDAAKRVSTDGRCFEKPIINFKFDPSASKPHPECKTSSIGKDHNKHMNTEEISKLCFSPKPHISTDSKNQLTDSDT